MRRWKWCVFALFLGAIWLTACGEEPSGPAPSLLVPPSWQGVWEITITSKECDTDSLIGVDVLVDPVCAGESIEEFLGLRAEDLEMVSCDGNFVDAGFVATCVGRTDLFGCSFDLSGTFSANRVDSTFAGGGVLKMTSFCSGDDRIDDCIVVELEGRRLATDTPECDAPVGLVTDVVRRRKAEHTRR